MRNPAIGLSMLLSVCALPFAALAAGESFDVSDQPTPKKDTAATAATSDVTVGVRYQSDSSALYGRYNGSPESGFYPYADFYIGQKNPWDSGDTHYFEMTGTNLTYNSDRVLPGANVDVRFGRRGSWGLRLFYDNISYIQSLTFHTPYTDTGSLLSGTPGGISQAGIALTNPPNAADIAISANVAHILSQRSIESARNTFGGAFAAYLQTHWIVASSFAHEHKTGTKENSLLQGTSTSINSSAGNFIYFPEPIDYDTDSFNISAAYSTRTVQFQLSYALSHFVDNRLFIVALDPFSSTTIKSVPLSATYALPPSNFAHLFKAQFGYNFDTTTRLTATASYGMQLQDANFVAPTTNPSVVIPPVPANSYDGHVDTYFASATLTSRPWRAVDFKLSYFIDDRRNQSPRLSYAPFLNDTTSVSGISMNAPYSFQHQNAVGEVGYRPSTMARFIAGYNYDQYTRTFSATNLNRESTYYVRMVTQYEDELTANLGVSYSKRTASDYFGDNAWAALGETFPTALDSQGLQHFFESARSRNEVKGEITWTPQAELAVTVTGKYYRDHYDQSVFGMTHDKVVTINPDISYSPTKDIETHLFYSYELLEYKLADKVSVSGGGGSQFFWNLKMPNSTHTAGASVDWRVNSTVKLGATYTFQRGTTGYDQSGFATAGLGTSPWNYNVVPLPSVSSILNSLDIYGEFQLAKDATLQVGYINERFHSKDYLNEQLPTSPLYANEVLGADGDPSYNVNVATVGFHFAF